MSGWTETFLTGNVGGGAQSYAANGRWGLRGDYCFMMVRDKDDGPTSLGGNGDTRDGHRVYGAVILNVVRWQLLIADAFASTVRIGAGMSDHGGRDVGLAAEPTHHVRSR